MTTFTENDIAQINQKLDRLTGTVSQVLINQESLKNDVTDLKIGQAKLEAKLEGKIDTINARFDAYKPALDKIPDLAEKVGELKNWRLNSRVC